MFFTLHLQVINEVIWLHLICCSPIVPVCQVCPSDPSEALMWQSSVKSIHTHFLETLQFCITNSIPQQIQHHLLRSVYFVTDLSVHNEEMDSHDRFQTDVLVNIDQVLRQLLGHLWDHNQLQNPASNTESRDAALRKYISPSLRASALVLCQRLPEAVRALDEGNLSMDACVLSCIFDVAGLCPRFQQQDGRCIGVAGYMIKAFLARMAPSGFSLLPSGQESTIDLCSYLALALDSSDNLTLPLKVILPSSDVSLQLLAFIFIHLYRSRQTGAVFSFPLERAVQLRLGPAHVQPIRLSGGCKYIEVMCSFIAKHFEQNTKGDALNLVEAARMYVAETARIA
jgi:hypothetical protein